MGNKNMPDLQKIHPMHISSVGTALPGIKPVNTAFMLKNKRRVVHPRHGFRSGTGSQNTDSHLHTYLSLYLNNAMYSIYIKKQCRTLKKALEKQPYSKGREAAV
jgi:hypothetical protein